MSRIEYRSMRGADQQVGLAVVVHVHAAVGTRSCIGDKGSIGQTHQQPLPPILWIGKDLRRIERLLRVTRAGSRWRRALQQGRGQQVPGTENACSERSYSTRLHQPTEGAAATQLSRPMRTDTTSHRMRARSEPSVLLALHLKARGKRG